MNTYPDKTYLTKITTTKLLRSSLIHDLITKHLLPKYNYSQYEDLSDAITLSWENYTAPVFSHCSVSLPPGRAEFGRTGMQHSTKSTATECFIFEFTYYFFHRENLKSLIYHFTKILGNISTLWLFLKNNFKINFPLLKKSPSVFMCVKCPHSKESK